jgi:sporulation protein YlmC with PRC-barrel domain
MGYTLQDIDDLQGATMVDKEGARIGKVEDVFLDRQTGRPAWAAVKTGLFGHKRTLVPITDAFLNPNAEVQVPFAKAQIRNAPSIEPGEPLTPELERSIWEHYGIGGYDEWGGEDRTLGLGLPDDVADATAPATLRLRRVVVIAVVPAADED